MGVSFKNSIRNGGFLLVFAFTQPLYSQFYHGIEFGINHTNPEFILNDSATPTAGTGYFFGYLAERELNDNLYFRLAANYNRRQFDAIAHRGAYTNREKWNLDVIEIPINFGYYLNWNQRKLQFFVDAGVNMAYNNKVSVTNNKETIRMDIGSDAEIKRLGMGANMGLGVLIKKRLKLRFHYYLGLSNLTSSEGNTWKNTILGFSMSYFVKDKQITY
ncbi:PorT family protein [Flavobacteriaceae bacterium F08102]|nr:PorT family protein [Flavobacteriaceae bacterium F08102]